MKTLKDLHFRKFEKDDVILNSASISVSEFLTTKEPGRGAARKFIQLSGHQIVKAILNLLPEHLRLNNPGKFFVYREHFSHPGYVVKVNEYDVDSKEIYPELPLTEICFDRTIGMISTGYSNSEYSQKLGIKYEVDGGVQIVMGTVVSVCTNFNIFGGRSIKSSKKDGIGVNELMDQVKEWLADAENIFNSDLATIAYLKSVPVNAPDQNYQMIGRMMVDYFKDFGARQVLQITELSRLAEKTAYRIATDHWEFTNQGTEIIRFDVGDSEFDRIRAFNEFVISEADREFARTKAIQQTMDEIRVARD